METTKTILITEAEITDAARRLYLSMDADDQETYTPAQIEAATFAYLSRMTEDLLSDICAFAFGPTGTSLGNFRAILHEMTR